MRSPAGRCSPRLQGDAPPCSQPLQQRGETADRNATLSLHNTPVYTKIYTKTSRYTTRRSTQHPIYPAPQHLHEGSWEERYRMWLAGVSVLLQLPPLLLCIALHSVSGTRLDSGLRLTQLCTLVYGTAAPGLGVELIRDSEPWCS
ncbi:unnamed protein product [Boreogadus saida]